MADHMEIAAAIRHFQFQMERQGITVTGFEVASDRDERAIAASVPQAMLMPIGLSADRPRTAVNGATVTVRQSRSR